MKTSARWAFSWVLLLPALAGAEDWPQWRGPAFNGSSGETHLPVTFSATEGLAWKTPLPGVSAATPIISGDRVFITAQAPSKSLLALCLDRTTGKVLWQKNFGKARDYPNNNPATPSPVTDGKRVVFLFSTGDLVALDLDGNTLWSRNLVKDYGDFAIQFGYSASPLLYQGRLFVAVIQHHNQIYLNAQGRTGIFRDGPPRESFLLAINPSTGRNLWKVARATDAEGESQESYSTPLPFDLGGRPHVAVAGADYITLHEVETGREIWRSASYNSRKDKVWRTVASPLAADGLIVAAMPQGNPLFAVRPADPPATQPVWRLNDSRPDVCSPLYYKGLLYVLDGDRRTLACVDPRTGATRWTGKLADSGVFDASPTGAAGKIYTISESGEVVVLAAGPGRFQVLHRTPLNDPCRASIAVSGGQLFIRTAHALWCFGPTQPQTKPPAGATSAPTP